MGIRSQIRNRGRFMPDSGHGGKYFIWVCLVSLVFHLSLFGGAFWFHKFEFLPPKPRVVRVDLVSFAPGPVGGQVKPEPVQARTPEPDKDSVSLKPASDSVQQVADTAPKPVPVIKPDISLKSKPKNIKDLMAARKAKAKPVEKKKTKALKPKPKKTPEQSLEKARQELAQKVESQNKAQIDQALKRLQASIEQTKNQKGPGSAPGSGTGATTKGNSPLTLYQIVLKNAIEQNWVFNDVMAGMNQKLEVKIFIKILKSGEIRDISYETRSGNQYLDESAKKAIRRASPLPELPKGMASYELVVGFTPKGLK